MNFFKWLWADLFGLKNGEETPYQVLFAGYRDWANEAFSELEFEFEIHRKTSKVKFTPVETHDELLSLLEENRYDLVFLAGWSEFIPSRLCAKHNIVAVHPSNLPDYAGGSPIQHQVIDGLTQTFMTMGKLIPNAKTDDWLIYYKYPISLEGDIDDIFLELTTATRELFRSLMVHARSLPSGEKYFEVIPGSRFAGVTNVRRRLKPEDSWIPKYKFSKLTVREIYNLIRCRTEPYPNAFIKDGTGTLRFTKVEFDEPESDET